MFRLRDAMLILGLRLRAAMFMLGFLEVHGPAMLLHQAWNEQI